MAKATVGAGGIEYIQGALKRPKKQNGHKHGTFSPRDGRYPCQRHA